MAHFIFIVWLLQHLGDLKKGSLSDLLQRFCPFGIIKLSILVGIAIQLSLAAVVPSSAPAASESGTH